MRVNKREIYRHLGFGMTEPDNRVRVMTEDCLSELSKVSSLRFCSDIFSLRLSGKKELDFTCFQTSSRDLYKNLKGCDRALLFAATLGAEVDRLILRDTKLKVSRAVILQAAAAAYIEAFCDAENERLKEAYLKEGCFLRPRFSPGYGDFPLSIQKELLGALDAEKRIGITLTDSFMMLPSKSVTAVIGVGRENSGGQPEGCVKCQKENCLFRRS